MYGPRFEDEVRARTRTVPTKSPPPDYTRICMYSASHSRRRASPRFICQYVVGTNLSLPKNTNTFSSSNTYLLSVRVLYTYISLLRDLCHSIFLSLGRFVFKKLQIYKMVICHMHFVFRIEIRSLIGSPCLGAENFRNCGTPKDWEIIVFKTFRASEWFYTFESKKKAERVLSFV